MANQPEVWMRGAIPGYPGLLVRDIVDSFYYVFPQTKQQQPGS